MCPHCQVFLFCCWLLCLGGSVLKIGAHGIPVQRDWCDPCGWKELFTRCGVDLWVRVRRGQYGWEVDIKWGSRSSALNLPELSGGNCEGLSGLGRSIGWMFAVLCAGLRLVFSIEVRVQKSTSASAQSNKETLPTVREATEANQFSHNRNIHLSFQPVDERRNIFWTR